MELGGYHQKIFRINLTNQKTETINLDQKTLYNFLGGRGIGTWLLWKELDPQVDPLGEENKIIIMTGPLTGTSFPSAGRTSFSLKSPLTGTILDSSLGGDFGSFIKKAGIDGFILEGKAEKPIYLVIKDGRVEFKDASELQGKTTSETEEELRRRYSGIGCITIGPAGENKARMANIMSKERAAGRGGAGAVMGSKNVKAIVIGGDESVDIKFEEAYERILKKIQKNIQENPLTGTDGSMARFGTNVLVHLISSADMMPHKNFSNEELDYEKVDPFSGETIREKYFKERTGCWACPVACGRIVEFDDKQRKGPEFESTVMLGPDAGFYDYEQITKLNHLCDEFGLDTIGIGNILALAREIGKIENFDAAIDLIKAVATGESVFAEGLQEASKNLGVSEKAMHVKGLSLPAYDPRGAKGIALAYATSNRGGCHLRAYTIAPEILGNPEFVDPGEKKGKPELVKRMQDYHVLFDSCIICKYYQLALFDGLQFQLDQLGRILTAVTGLKWTNDHLYEVGERVYTIERQFNSNAGFTKEDDTLPETLDIDLTHLRKEYYRIRGWGADGIPEEPPPLKEPEIASKVEIPHSPIEKIEFPQIQVALDLDAEISTIQRIAKKAYEGGARIIEAGTPALKRHGADKLIPALKEVAPEALIVADFKTMDVGDLEARIAFRAGADITAILAIGNEIKIDEAMSEAISQDKMILIDFIDVPDPLKKMQSLKKKLQGEEDKVIFCLHRGISQQLKGRGIHEEGELISKAREIAGEFRLGVAGGLKEGIVGSVAAHKPDIFIIGSAIYHASNPRRKVEKLLQEIRNNYPKEEA